MMSAVITLLLFVLLAFGMPVAFALVVSGAVGLYWIGGLDVLAGVITTTPLSTAGSYELISIPMFILMAEFVILSGVADDLFKAASTWVGRVPGGLGMATALAGAGFGAISGSSTASAATLSSTTMPAMLKAGYDPKLAGGVVAISGTLAMLIPPSIALVLYGIIADVSIGQLLIGGVIPGILGDADDHGDGLGAGDDRPELGAARRRLHDGREVPLAQGRRADDRAVHDGHRRHLQRHRDADRGVGAGRVRRRSRSRSARARSTARRSSRRSRTPRTRAA
jgi:hypothetical protein